MQEISDIIDTMPSPFNSFELAIFIAVAICAISLIIYAIYKLLKPKPKSAKERLLELEINSKESLFEFSKLASKIDNSNRLKELLYELEPYKFKKGYTPLPKTLKEKIYEYIKSI